MQFGPDVIYTTPTTWYLEQVRPFLEDPDAAGPSLVARYTGRVTKKSETAFWQSQGMEYGILELTDGIVGDEWVTFPGHIHRGPRGSWRAAVMEVLHGSGALILQAHRNGVREVSVAWLHPNDRIFLPPGYFHAFVNSGSGPLVIAEVHSTDTVWDFVEVARRRGLACYFGPGAIRANPHYSARHTSRELDVKDLETPVQPGHDLYHAVVHGAERFRFLRPV